MRKGFVFPLIPILIVGLITVSVAGFLILRLKQETNSGGDRQSQIPTQTVTQNSPSPSPQRDETTNWKAYTNEKYKFTFKYPESWIAATDSEIAKVNEYLGDDRDWVFRADSDDENGIEFDVVIFKNVKDYQGAEKLICGPPTCGGVQYIDTKIGNTVYRRPETTGTPRIDATFPTYLLKENTLYYFSMNTILQEQNENAFKILNQSLSTFKFLD